MGSYVPSTPAQRRQMLEAVGADSPAALYADVPEALRLSPVSGDGLSELEVSSLLRAAADKNRVFSAIFRGAGAYDHYIPAIVKTVAAKEEFVTAYTPYQAEISQGLLQSIFEYQTMICALTGMDAANASVYDGASAMAEAAAMCRDRRRGAVYLSGGVNPMTRRTVETYCAGAGVRVEVLPLREGKTDLAALEGLPSDAACVCFQQPNYYGLLEDAAAIADLAHRGGAKCVMGVHPIAAAVLEAPGACGADIAVGEGQPLGLPLGFGGPYLGFMAATAPLMRRLPGRIVGETADARGNRCFVLTLQAREQHIRREKAASNICSNEALCALTAAVYLSAMGPEGLRRAALSCHAKAHYLAAGLSALPGFSLRFGGDFFNEFLTETPVPAQVVLQALADAGILGGLPAEGGILWCATEKNTKAQMDEVLRIVKEVSARWN